MRRRPNRRQTPTPEATPEHPGLPYDPDGPDRDCSDFADWWDAQNFYLAAGGPDEDPHGLDGDNDGHRLRVPPRSAGRVSARPSRREAQ